MSEETKNTKTYETEVLVIGGGFGGLSAAIRIKELAPETAVLVVDKQTIGWGGKANKGAGVLWVLAPGDNIEAFVDFHVKNIGIYLNDQDLLYAIARESYGAAQKLADCPALIDAWATAALRVRPDILVLAHGGPIAEPEDAEFVLKACRVCHGFYGASSMERLPVETALTEQARRFKAIKGRHATHSPEAAANDPRGGD